MTSSEICRTRTPVQAEVMAKTTTSAMRVTDTDLPIVVEPAEEQNKRDLTIMAGGRSQNT